MYISFLYSLMTDASKFDWARRCIQDFKPIPENMGNFFPKFIPRKIGLGGSFRGVKQKQRRLQR